MARLGAGTRVVKETVDSLQGLLEYAKINKIPVSKALTIAQLVERITNDPSSPSEAPGVFDEEEPQRQSLMSRLGAAEGAARDSSPSVSSETQVESGPLFEPTMDRPAPGRTWREHGKDYRMGKWSSLNLRR